MRWGAFRRKGDGSKYHNRPTRCAQERFHHSGKEARRCDELHALLGAGLIADLKAHPQPVRKLVVNGVEVTTYRPDFEYMENGSLVVEDVKGFRTEVYKLKARLMLALGIEIKET